MRSERIPAFTLSSLPVCVPYFLSGFSSAAFCFQQPAHSLLPLFYHGILYYRLQCRGNGEAAKWDGCDDLGHPEWTKHQDYNNAAIYTGGAGQDCGRNLGAGLVDVRRPCLVYFPQGLDSTILDIHPSRPGYMPMALFAQELVRRARLFWKEWIKLLQAA